jgi:MFS family permease
MVISMLVIGTLSLGLFVVVEWRLAKLPVMPVTIFNNVAVSVTLFQTFLFGAVHQATLYFLPLYLLNVRQFSQLHSASMIAGLSISQSLASVGSGLYISRFKRYGEVIIFGFSLWLLGIGLFLTYSRTTSPGQIVGPFLAAGFGCGCAFQPTVQALQAHSSRSRRAVIISNRNFFRCAGGAVGLAATAAVMQATLRESLPSGWERLADNTYALPSDVGHGQEAEGIYDAYMMASRAAFILWLPMMGLCLLGCVFVRDRGLEPLEDETETPRTAQD